MGEACKAMIWAAAGFSILCPYDFIGYFPWRSSFVIDKASRDDGIEAPTEIALLLCGSRAEGALIRSVDYWSVIKSVNAVPWLVLVMTTSVRKWSHPPTFLCKVRQWLITLRNSQQQNLTICQKTSKEEEIKRRTPKNIVFFRRATTTTGGRLVPKKW